MEHRLRVEETERRHQIHSLAVAFGARRFALLPETFLQSPAYEKPGASVRRLRVRWEAMMDCKRSRAVFRPLLCNSCEGECFVCFPEMQDRLPESVAEQSGLLYPFRPSVLSNFRSPSRCKMEHRVCPAPAYAV